MRRGRRSQPRLRAAPAENEESREQTMSRALRLLARRPRTEAELRAKLASDSPAGEEVIDSCISRLRELSLIDDLRYAEGYARSKLSVKPVGRQKLARELAAKSISRETIDEALSRIFDEQDEQSLLTRAIEKHVRLHGPPRDRAAAKRLFDHLARRGFDYELIRRNLPAFQQEIAENEDEQLHGRATQEK
jgi:regulatory protein